MGLAPQLVEEIFEIVARLNREEGDFLVAEQNTALALRYANYATSSRTAASCSTRGRRAAREADVKEFYLGSVPRAARASATSSTTSGASAGSPDSPFPRGDARVARAAHQPAEILAADMHQLSWSPPRNRPRSGRRAGRPRRRPCRSAPTGGTAPMSQSRNRLAISASVASPGGAPALLELVEATRFAAGTAASR